jgi:hypothetical protein
MRLSSPAIASPPCSPPEHLLGDGAADEGPRDRGEQGAADDPAHADAAPAAAEAALERAGPAHLRAGGHPGEGTRVVSRLPLVLGGLGGEAVEHLAALLRRQLREGLLVRPLDLVGWCRLQQVAVALDRPLVLVAGAWLGLLTRLVSRLVTRLVTRLVALLVAAQQAV